MPSQTEQEQAVAALLRQLSTGLSAYRMYPGDLKQPAFVAALDRIRAAAERALRWGAVETNVLGARFHMAGEPVRSDDIIERLAMACYERRAEILCVDAVPDIHDLAALYEALSAPPPVIEEAGGVQNLLVGSGVISISLGELTLQPEDPPPAAAAATDEQASAWQRLQDAAALAAELLPSAPEGTPLDLARTILDGFRRLVASLPPGHLDDPQVYRKLQETMTHLPVEAGRALSKLMLDHQRDDPVSERVIGTMTDTELARLLIDTAVGGEIDPAAAARQLVTSGARREDLQELVAAFATGSQPDGTILTGVEQMQVQADLTAKGTPLGQTLSDLLARRLLAHEQDDLAGMRASFPSSQPEDREATLRTLRDYFRAEDDPARIATVLDAWVERAREALLAGDVEAVEQLMHAVDGVTEGAEEDLTRASLAEEFRRRVIDADTLANVVSAKDQEGAPSVRPLLQPFGRPAVEGLLDMLAEEPDRGRRAMLVGLVGHLARGHHEAVGARLFDVRWYVARNAVTILSRLGERKAMPLIDEAARHSEPLVRREAVQALVAVAGRDGVPMLRSLVSDPDPRVRDAAVGGLGSVAAPEAAQALAWVVRNIEDPNSRTRALDELARHSSPEGVRLLQELFSARGRDRLPRVLRRHAKGLLRRRAK